MASEIRLSCVLLLINQYRRHRNNKRWFLFGAGHFWGGHDQDVCGNLCTVAALLASVLVYEEGPQQQNQHQVSPLSVCSHTQLCICLKLAVPALLASDLVHEEGPQQQNQHQVSPLSVCSHTQLCIFLDLAVMFSGIASLQVLCSQVELLQRVCHWERHSFCLLVITTEQHSS